MRDEGAADGTFENPPDRFSQFLPEFRRLAPVEDYAGRKAEFCPRGGDYCRRPDLSDPLDED